MIHELKCWPEYFKEVKKGNKTFEVRKNDRNYRRRDILHLNEYDPELKTFTGDKVYTSVNYVLYGGAFGIQDGYVVMSIRLIKPI